MSPASIRLEFEIKDGAVLLADSIECSAMPFESATLDSMEGYTGTWVQLENARGETIYRYISPTLIMPSSYRSGMPINNRFSALVPFLVDAATVSIYHWDESDAPAAFASESRLLASFPFPKAFTNLKQAEPSLPDDICKKGRGLVLKKTNKVYHGRTHNIFNFVVLADKFDENEQGVFNSAALECVDYVLAHPPFNGIYGRGCVNVFFVEVSSNQFDPSYFNTTSSGGTALNWDTVDVSTVCNALFSNEEGQPYWHWAAVLVNYDIERVGTARDNQFATGLKSDDFRETFQHEFGHAAFGLLDEYDEISETYPYNEPAAPNVTKENTIEKLKWKEFVTPGTPIPTHEHIKDEPIGCYEGACRYKYGVYRPAKRCVMRDQMEVEGKYCTVCMHHAQKITARGLQKFVPVPGYMLYSNISNKWENLIAGAGVADEFSTLENYSAYDNVLDSLRKKEYNNAIKDAFRESEGITLPDNMNIHEMYYFSDSKLGLWYLLEPGTTDWYYMYCFQINHETEIALGKMKLPQYPSASFFDGAVTGREAHIFCIDDGKLSYTKQNQFGEIDNFMVQHVEGLEPYSLISDISTTYNSSRIFVGVVDGGSVKIGAYELLTLKWSNPGFITLPSAEDIEYSVLRIAQAGSTVHAVMADGNRMYYSGFNVPKMHWGEVIDVAPAAEFCTVCAQGANVFVLTYNRGAVELRAYNTINRTWSEPKNITEELNLNSEDLITSFEAAYLDNRLHIVLLSNQRPFHATYNVIEQKIITSLYEITQLEGGQIDISAMMLHASDKQLHLILSNLMPHPAVRTIEEKG